MDSYDLHDLRTNILQCLTEIIEDLCHIKAVLISKSFENNLKLFYSASA